jgi:hypothetical protein
VAQRNDELPSCMWSEKTNVNGNNDDDDGNRSSDSIQPITMWHMCQLLCQAFFQALFTLSS